MELEYEKKLSIFSTTEIGLKQNLAQCIHIGIQESFCHSDFP